MANHVIPENPQISLELQKLRTTDRAHADIFNNINAKLIENDAYLEKEIREAAKEGIQLTTDSEFVNSLINNTAKAGSVLLFSNIGERYGNVTDESYTLYAGLMNCNRYSGCDITVKAIHTEEQSLHPMFFQSPNFFIAKVDKQNAKRVVVYPLGGGNVEELRERLDSVEEKANQAFTQAHEGKQLIADALVSKQQIVSSSASFGVMAQKIRELKKLETIYLQSPVGRALKNKPNSPSVFSENYGTDYGFWRISNSSADTISNYAVITKPINLTNKSILFTGANKNHVVGPDFCFYLTNNRNLLDEDYLKNIDKYTLASYLNENKKVYLGVYFDVSELSGDWYIVSFQKYSRDNIIPKKIYLV